MGMSVHFGFTISPLEKTRPVLWWVKENLQEWLWLGWVYTPETKDNVPALPAIPGIPGSRGLAEGLPQPCLQYQAVVGISKQLLPLFAFPTAHSRNTVNSAPSLSPS